jgi:hypothetical protein
MEESGEDGQAFIPYYGIQYKTKGEITIIHVYYAFTSLSTVGFGDYVPRSNIERAVGAFMLLMGVAVFSYIMGNFIEILDGYMKFNKDTEFGDELTRFFGLVQSFNGMDQMLKERSVRFESYFDYRWRNDKNIAFREKEDLDIYNQMPIDVKGKLMKEFMHKNFLKKFSKTFKFKNEDVEIKLAYYGW